MYKSVMVGRGSSLFSLCYLLSHNHDVTRVRKRYYWREIIVN